MAPKFIFARVWRGESLVQCKREAWRDGMSMLVSVLMSFSVS